MKKTSCYTCHFTNEGFNTGTASCLLCHTLPTQEITVHKELSPEEAAKLKSPELTKQTVRMDHRTILERKVDVAGRRVGIILTGGNLDLDSLPWMQTEVL